MNLFQLVLQLGVLLVSATQTAAGDGDVGVYRLCNGSCLEVELRPDETFTLRRFGERRDDITASSVQGTWRLVSDGVVEAVVRVSTAVEGPTPIYQGGSDVKVQLADLAGTRVAGAAVTVGCGDRVWHRVSGEDGVADVGPPCPIAVVVSVQAKAFLPEVLQLAQPAAGHLCRSAGSSWRCFRAGRHRARAVADRRRPLSDG